jgi:hypothetical protein
MSQAEGLKEPLNDGSGALVSGGVEDNGIGALPVAVEVENGARRLAVH